MKKFIFIMLFALTAFSLPDNAKAVQDSDVVWSKTIVTGGDVNGVAFSHDGSKIFISEDNIFNGTRLEVYDTESGTFINYIETGFKKSANMVSISKDGQYLVTGSNEGIAVVFDANTYKEIRRFTPTLPYTPSGIIDAKISPDNTYLAVGTRGAGVYLFDFSSGNFLIDFAVDVGYQNVFNLEFTLDSKYLIFTAFEQPLRIVDLTNNSVSRWFDYSNNNCPNSIGISPDNDNILVLTENHRSFLWNFKLQTKIITYPDTTMYSRKVKFNSNGNYFIIPTYNNIPLSIIEAKTGKEVKTYSFAPDVFDISLDDKYIIVCGGYYYILLRANWNPTTVKESFDKENINLKIYPNPNNKDISFYFYLPDSGKIDLLMFDITGKKIIISDEYFTVGNHEIKRNYPNLAPGEYIVKLIFEGKEFSQKLIIDK